MAISNCNHVTIPPYCSDHQVQVNIACGNLRLYPGEKLLYYMNDVVCYCICFAGIPSCDDVQRNYCQDNASAVKQGCSNAELPIGQKLLITVDGKDCYCRCPGATGTRAMTITLADGALLPINELSTTGHQVLAAGLDLNFTPHAVALVSEAEHGRVHNAVYIRYPSGEAQAELVLAGDCQVLVHRDGRREMIAARLLKLADRLVDRHGAEVTVAALDSGTFDGALWEVATRMDPPGENYAGHLILTGGIVTGDLATSTFSTADRSRGSLTAPLVGSRRWVEINGPNRLTQPVEVQGGQFTSGALYEIAIPDNASP